MVVKICFVKHLDGNKIKFILFFLFFQSVCADREQSTSFPHTTEDDVQLKSSRKIFSLSENSLGKMSFLCLYYAGREWMNGNSERICSDPGIMNEEKYIFYGSYIKRISTRSRQGYLRVFDVLVLCSVYRTQVLGRYG